MPIPSNVLFVGQHTGPEGVDDPNLFSLGDFADALSNSASVSLITSGVTSAAASGALNSIPVSTADSKAVSSGLRSSVADSKAVSGSINTSVADSKSISNSANISIADSKAVSVAAATIVPTVGGIPGFQQPYSTAVIRTANAKMAETISVVDFGATAAGLTDDRTAILAAQTAAGTGGRVMFPRGTYRIASDCTLTASLSFMNGAVLKPDSGVTVTVNAHVIDTFSQIFDVSGGGTVSGAFVNRILRPEWWGAVGVLAGVLDDARAATNATALRAVAACLNGHTLEFTNYYVISSAVTFPHTTSWTLRGHAGTGAGLRAATTTPSITLFDFSSCADAAKRIIGLEAINPTTGMVGGTGFDCNASNGLWFSNCWAGGMAIGARIRGSFNTYLNCTAEFCTVGLQFDTTVAPESQHKGWTFYANTTDVKMDNLDMAGVILRDSTHSSTASTCYDINNCTNVDLAGVNHFAASSGNTIHLRGGASQCRIRGVKTNAGAIALFLENCTDCEVDGLEADGVTTGVHLTNASARNVVRAARVRGATTGMNLETSGADNLVEGFDLRSCTTGLRLGSSGAEINDGIITGNSTDVTLATTLTALKSRNVSVGTLGDLDPVAGKITYLWTYSALNRIEAVGLGSPEGVVTAPIGSRYCRTDGGASTTLYVKTSGTGNTGWTAK